MQSLILFTIFIFGASIGSFLNVLIDRLPNNESIMGRSRCDHCGKKLIWFDLFPIFSFFFLGAKSRCCHRELSFQYPLIETLTGMIFMLIYFLNPGISILGLVSLWGLASCMLVIFSSDLKYHLVSDYILLSFLVFAFLFHSSIHGFSYHVLISSFVSGFIVSAPILLVYVLSKERAMGLGDVYISALIGFLLGWQVGYIALYIAFVTGAIFGVGLMILHKKKIKSKIPFGPFLVTGTLLMMIWGDKALKLIESVYGF